MQAGNDELKAIVGNLIDEWSERQYHGSIVINFSFGKVPRLNLNRSIELPKRIGSDRETKRTAG